MQLAPIDGEINSKEAAVKATKMIIGNQEKVVRTIKAGLDATKLELKKLRSKREEKRQVTRSE
jgi:hypothetical protein